VEHENHQATPQRSIPEQQQPAARELVLPILVFGIVEVRRLKRELESLDEYIRQAVLREPGKQAALPRVSRLLDALATDNGRNLLQATDRRELHQFLDHVTRSAPTIHISFASDPSSAFTAKLVSWLRANIHPAVLLQTGLQPTIAAGCILRTANKSFDFSLRERFTEQRDLLLEALDTPFPTSAPESVAGESPEVAANAASQPQVGAPS